jgi:hypothetical protein
MSKIFKLVRPKSLTNPAYAEFEYLIRWIGRDGSDYLYMFYDAEFETKINASQINTKDSERIESIINSESSSITFFVNDISLNDLKVFGEMLANKYVTRIFKDETIQRFAIDSNTYKYKQRGLRFDLELSIIPVEKMTWK